MEKNLWKHNSNLNQWICSMRQRRGGKCVRRRNIRFGSAILQKRNKKLLLQKTLVSQHSFAAQSFQRRQKFQSNETHQWVCVSVFFKFKIQNPKTGLNKNELANFNMAINLPFTENNLKIITRTTVHYIVLLFKFFFRTYDLKTKKVLFYLKLKLQNAKFFLKKFFSHVIVAVFFYNNNSSSPSLENWNDEKNVEVGNKNRHKRTNGDDHARVWQNATQTKTFLRSEKGGEKNERRTELRRQRRFLVGRLL